MKLSPETVYLWFTFVEEIQDKKLLAEYLGLLPASEKEKYERYRFDLHKKRYLVGRALIRTLLSRCTGATPEQIMFSREAHGRPFLPPSGQETLLQFNLSYTDGLVAAALTLKHRVGMDVENTSMKINCLEIADRYFSPSEYQELRQLPEPLMKQHFFELWTLKEAFLKAQGHGLNKPLDKVSFHLGETDASPQKSTYCITDAGIQWQLRTLKPSDIHRASFCVCQDTEIPIRVISKKAVPLEKEADFTMDGE